MSPVASDKHRCTKIKTFLFGVHVHPQESMFLLQLNKSRHQKQYHKAGIGSEKGLGTFRLANKFLLDFSPTSMGTKNLPSQKHIIKRFDRHNSFEMQNSLTNRYALESSFTCSVHQTIFQIRST